MSFLSGKLTILDAKHTFLFNHVYEKNHEGNLKYLEKIANSRKISPSETSLDLDYSGTADKSWVNTWKLRTSTSDEILTKIITKIQNAENGKKIERMSLNDKGIYIGKFKLNDVDYPIAVYSERATIDNITKVQVTDIADLDKDENKKHLKSEETFIKYLLIAFYEDGDNEPVLMMQIEKFDFSKQQNTKEVWLKYLKVITENRLSNDAESGPLVWGNKVTNKFKNEVIGIAEEIGSDPNYLMAIMAFESGGKFSSDVQNPYSGAVGLIQFMPATAENLGTTVGQLKKMTAEDQLFFVKKYFEPYKDKLKDVCDFYMAVLWPKGIGKESNYAIFEEGTICYEQNSGLDSNGDGKVTKNEACKKVLEKYESGKNQMK